MDFKSARLFCSVVLFLAGSSFGNQNTSVYKLGLLTPVNSSITEGKRDETIFKSAVAVINNLCGGRQVRLEPVVGNEEDCLHAVKRLDHSQVVAIIGPTMSSCAILASKHYGDMLPIISSSVTSSALSNKTEYPGFFRTTSSNVHQATALAAFLHKYGITQVGTLCINETDAKALFKKFRTTLKSLVNPSITIVKRVTCQNASDGSITECLKELRSSGARAIVINAASSDASCVILNKIVELEMYGQGWTWLATEGVVVEPVTNQPRLENVLEGFIAIAPKGAEGPVYMDFLGHYLTIIPPENSTVSKDLATIFAGGYTGQLINAVNVVANVLKRVSGQRTPNDTRKLLYQGLKNITLNLTTVQSATGFRSKVFFDENQEAAAAYDVINIQNGMAIVIGSYAEKHLAIHRNPIFPGGITKPVVKQLHYMIAGFFPLSTMGNHAQEWVSAFKLAVEIVNADRTFKSSFKYQIFDEGPTDASCESVAKNLPRDIDMIVGASSSSCSLELANVTAQRKIPQISYASTSIRLPEATMPPFFYRIAPSGTQQGRALAEIVKRYKWSKIGVMTAGSSSGLASAIEEELRTARISLSGSWHIPSNASQAETDKQFIQMKASENLSAVNLLVSEQTAAPRVLQAAHTVGVTGTGWTWLVMDDITSSDYSSSRKARQALQGMVGTRPQGGSGSAYDSLLKLWRLKNAMKYPGTLHATRIKTAAFTAQVYDAVLAFAHAGNILYDSRQVTRNTPSNKVKELLVTALRNVSFLSATGRNVSFNENNEISGSLDIVNYVGREWLLVGHYDVKTQQLNMTGNDIVWSGGSFTPHSTDVPSRHQMTYIHLAIVLGATLLCFVLVAVVMSRYLTSKNNTLTADNPCVTVIENKGAKRGVAASCRKSDPSNGNNERETRF